jgi:hypothetical protein
LTKAARKSAFRAIKRGALYEAARVAACREILDRAYGKAMQPIQGTVEYGVSQSRRWRLCRSDVHLAVSEFTLGPRIFRMWSRSVTTECA